MTKTVALDFTARHNQAPSPEASRQRTISFHEYNRSPASHRSSVTTLAPPKKTVIIAPDRAERDELTQLIRAYLYAQGKLGGDAHAVSVLVEKDAGNKMRVEGYELGEKIQYKTGSPNGISHDSLATVIATQPRTNQLSVWIDSTRDIVSYNPNDRHAQTRESRIFTEETREIAEGERIRFTRYDKDLGVKLGDLGIVTHLGQDNSMTVGLNSGKTAELSPEKTKHLDYGHTVDVLKNVRVERVIATGDGLAKQAFQGASAKADLSLYTGMPAPALEFSAAKELDSPEIAQPAMQHDFGVGF